MYSIIAVITIIISILALLVSTISLTYQRTSYKNNVRPTIDIVVGDYEYNIYIKLVNNGIGPAKITGLNCIYHGNIPITNKQSESIMTILKEPGTTSSIINHYNNYVLDIVGRTIPPGGSIVIVQKKNGTTTENIGLRLMLRDIEIIVKYEDIYCQSFSSNRYLDFFGRNVSD